MVLVRVQKNAQQMLHPFRVIFRRQQDSIPLVQTLQRAVSLLSPSRDVISCDLYQRRLALELVSEEPPITRPTLFGKLKRHARACWKHSVIAS